MHTKNSTITRASYLLTCDLINKYNLSTPTKEPRIKKIVLQFSLNNFVNISSFLGNSNIDNTNTQAKATLLFYILFGFLPKFTFNSTKTKLKGKTTEKNDYTLTLNLNSKNEIRTFLSELNLDPNFFYNLVDSASIKNLNSVENLILQNKNLHRCDFKIPMINFFSVNEYFTTKSADIKINKMLVHISFIYENTKGLGNIQNVIKNTSFIN